MKFLIRLFGVVVLISVNYAFAANFQGPAWPNDTVPYVYSTSSPLAPVAKASFEAAVAYYNDNTRIKLVAAQPGHSYSRVVTVSGITSGNSNATVGYRTCTFCSNTLKLRENADVQTAVHEIFHVLGFKHEHQRADRDENILVDVQALNSDGVYNSTNYGTVSSSYVLGTYDLRSVSHYRSTYFSVLNLESDAFELLELMATNVNYTRGFRINAVDSTPATIFDNPAIHMQNQPTMKVEDVSSGWHSAVWNFKYTGSGNVFRIESYWQKNQYLVNSSGAPAIVDSSSFNINSNNALWELSISNGKFRLKNLGNSRYLHNNGGLLTLSTNSTGTMWSIQANVPYGPYNYLSIMDQVALHKAYGEVFRIQLSDSTSSNTDNLTVHMQNLNADGSLDVTTIPFNPTNFWHSAMWELVQKGKYFMIKNLWTGEFIHTENGAVTTDPDGTLNGAGVNIIDWHSAHWELEILEKSFRIKNQWTGKYLYKNNAKLGVTDFATDADSNWDISVVVWP